MDVQHCTKPCPNDLITINENNNNDYTLKTPIHTSKNAYFHFMNIFSAESQKVFNLQTD